MNQQKYKIQIDRLKDAKEIIEHVHFEDTAKINLRNEIEIAILRLKKKLEEDEDDLTYSIFEWNSYDVMQVIRNGQVVFERGEKDLFHVKVSLKSDGVWRDMNQDFSLDNLLESLKNVIELGDYDDIKIEVTSCNTK